MNALPQHESYKGVSRKVFGNNIDINDIDIDIYVVDTGCSSSLYAINLRMKALQNGDADLVIARRRLRTRPPQRMHSSHSFVD